MFERNIKGEERLWVYPLVLYFTVNVLRLSKVSKESITLWFGNIWNNLLLKNGIVFRIIIYFMLRAYY